MPRLPLAPENPVETVLHWPASERSGRTASTNMKRKTAWVLASLLLTPGAFAQFRLGGGGYQKHSFAIGGGAGIPRGDLQSLLDTSPALRINYGCRFMKNFQADIGFDTVFHAANIRDYYESQFGDLRIKDYQYFLPMGGRVIIPLVSNRLQLQAGGGGVWMKYSERIRQPLSGGNSSFRLDCPVCTSRSGWGYYSMLGASYALDRSQLFRLGVTTKLYRGQTSGDPLGPIPGIQTNDQWLITAAEFSINF